MNTPLPRKLGIKPGFHVALIDSPPGFERELGPLPEGVRAGPRIRGPLDVAVLFSKERSHLEAEFDKAARRLAPAGGLWVAYPKKASNVETDLSFGVVQQVGLSRGLVDNKSCAIDDIWSAVRFVIRLRDR